MDPGDLRVGLRCPICRNLDWHRDGMIVAEVDGGRLEIDRVQEPAVDEVSIWSCNQCAHELPSWTALSRSLSDLVAPVRARSRAS